MITPTTIDLSRVPLPAALETVSFEALASDFQTRFQTAWDAARLRDPALPAYDASPLEADPASILGEVASYLRVLDRQRVNDVLRSLFPTTAVGADLDALVARQNVQRLVLAPATDTAPVVMESDAALLRRYLLSFDRGSAGSADRYLFEAYTVWPQMGDAAVNGFDVHGRRGDTDIVIIGPAGRAPTADERQRVSLACRAPSVKPEAVSVAVLPARRVEYGVLLSIEIPPGPDASLVRADLLAAIRSAALARTIIGGEIPAGFFLGIAYNNPNVITAADEAPAQIAPDPYAVPVMLSADVNVRVRA